MENDDLEYFHKMLSRWLEDLYKQADVIVTDLQELELQLSEKQEYWEK